MKNTFACLFIVILLISSCSSVKENISPINTYLKSKLDNNVVVIVIENKINNSYTIDLFKKRSITPINANTIENSIVLKTLLFEEKYWSKMNKK